MAPLHPVNDMCHKFLARTETMVHINPHAVPFSVQKIDIYYLNEQENKCFFAPQLVVERPPEKDNVLLPRCGL